MRLSLAGLSDVRGFLVADIIAAWGTQKVHTSAPELETATEAPKLPVAALILNPSRFDSAGNGLNSQNLRPLFRIVGRFTKPERVDLAATKTAKMQLLLDRLTATWNYHGASYFPAEIVYSQSPDESDAVRGFYEISLDLPLHL
jgi:hypothetical protein